MELIIGLFGGGVVGGGFYELIQQLNNLDHFSCTRARRIRIKTICVRNQEKKRDFEINADTKIVTDYDEIWNDPEINCIVETIGGINEAKEIVFRAISEDKHVITANKALIATYLTELLQLLEDHPTVRFGYEASVCGGIPLINTLQTTYLGDTVHKVCGIMNGTTNFMLSQMSVEGASDGAAVDYHSVLREAQSLGYAEADPSSDVEGWDVQAKITILTRLAFGATPSSLSCIPTTGITALEKIDFDFVRENYSSTIKLIGTAALKVSSFQQNQISVYVSPTIVSLSSAIASTNGPNNIVISSLVPLLLLCSDDGCSKVVIESQNLQRCVLIGPGAGRYPTANSVLSDVLRISQDQCPVPFPKNNPSLTISSDYTARFYLRVSRGIHDLSVESILKSFEEIAHSVSLPIISSTAREDSCLSRVHFIFITSTITFSIATQFIEEIRQRFLEIAWTTLVMPFYEIDK